MTRRRGGSRTGSHLVSFVLVGTLGLSACTNSGADPTASPTASAASRSPSVTTPTAAATPSPAPEDAEEMAVAAYEDYLAAVALAVEQGDEPVDLEDVATGQALVAAQARVAGLASQNRRARGDLVADPQEVQLDDDSATISDCYRDELVEYDRDTDEQVADRGGTRFAATVKLERTDGAWIVTEFVEGDFCVPDDIAGAVAARYLEFWAAVADAGRPPNPDHAGLNETAGGEQLAGLRERLAQFRDEGLEVRGEHTSHPVVTRVSGEDTVAYVRDCRELDPDGGIYDAETGELVQGGADPGERSLWEARLELVDGSWRVVDADLEEEGSGCETTSA